MYRVTNLEKAFGSLEVLHGVEFTLPRGKSIALLGASGCGKSVLFHILAGLTPADAGEFWVDDQQVNHFDVSYMQQKDLLLPWYNLLDNAVLPLTLSGWRQKDAYDEVGKYLNLFGLESFKMYYPEQLSGGMRQRVALLRAMLHKKPLVLMDEPFSALDALTASELRMFVKKLQQKEQFTLFFVTHNVEEAIDLADEIWVMHKNSQPSITIMPDLDGSYEEKRAYLWNLLGIL